MSRPSESNCDSEATGCYAHTSTLKRTVERSFRSLRSRYSKNQSSLALCAKPVATVEKRLIKKFAAPIVMALLCLTLQDVAAVAQSSRQSGRRIVKVYFYHDPGEYIDISSVRRSVIAASPARGAIEAMLNGPTRDEMKRGFGPIIGAREFRIGSLKIAKGTATINFVTSRKWLGWPGDLGPIRFKKAVELTLKQFPNVQNVIVSLNGETGFADAP